MAIFPKCPFVWCAFPQVFICLKYSFSPRASLPQVPIYFDAHVPQMPICSKCPFTPNSPYLPNIRLPRCPSTIVPIISLNPHLSRCPFAPSTQLSRTQMSGIYLSGTQMYGPQLFGTIYPGAHLSVTQKYGPQLFETHLPGAHLFWSPFVLVPICPGPKCPKTACYIPHLLTSKLLQVFGYRQMAQFKLRRHCLFH